MLGKAPIYKLSRSKAPKTQQVCHYNHARKNSGFFLFVDFSSRKNFASLGSFAKVFFPVQSKIPCFASLSFALLSFLLRVTIFIHKHS